MARLHVTYDETEEGSGVRRASIKAWRRKNRPGLSPSKPCSACLDGTSSRSARQDIARRSAARSSRSRRSSVSRCRGHVGVDRDRDRHPRRFPFLRDPTAMRPVRFKAQRKRAESSVPTNTLFCRMSHPMSRIEDATTKQMIVAAVARNAKPEVNWSRLRCSMPASGASRSPCGSMP